MADFPPKNFSPVSRIWRFARWPFVVFFVLFVGLVIYRIPAATEKRDTEKQVAKIHATKLKIDDVMGVNLPPVPDQALADATIAGIDANTNGIRDDVELAIFAEYPDSARTRAVLLQYALALQMEATQEIVNTDVVNAILEEDSRAGDCIADVLVPRKNLESPRDYSDIERIDAYIDFVAEKQFNTNERKTAKTEFYKYMGSYSNSPNLACDIDYLALPN